MKWAAGGFFALLLMLPLMLFAVSGNDPKPALGQGCGDGGGGSYAPVDPKGAAAALTPDQRSIVASIIGIGKQRGLPPQAWQSAIQAGKTESELRNLPDGDRDSIGVFQMRPSMGWGTPAQLRDVTYQVNKWYSVLAAVPGWQSMRTGDAAQRVERSGFPERYHKWEAFAAAVIAQNGDSVPPAAGAPPGGVVGACGPSALDANRMEAAVSFALAQQGKPYQWGATGPFFFDCSGLMLRSYQQVGITLPRTSAQQYTAGARVPVAQARRGDLLFWAYNTNDPATIHHVAMFLGDGQMVEAQQDGVPVKISRIRNVGLMPSAVTFLPTQAPGGS
ncbi:NlpC/P60 family protein [Amycolatopsis sp. A1MSW2902]|uniref:C40 family peptidase n=1 Tax=Amycolatopsis sp. A1MSW2902 TaxID=687413 RepID=UPI00307F7B44